MNSVEIFILRWLGRIIQLVGVSGFIITLFFDRIARGTAFDINWLQALGLVVFMGIFVFGGVVEEFLRTVKSIIEKHLNS